AKESGVDCIKTETFQRENIVFDKEMTCSHEIRGEFFTENLLEHMEQYQLTFEEHEAIKKYSDELGLPFMSTAHDFESIDFLADIKADAVKISSADIIHYPLLRYAARTGMAIFVDTGGAKEFECLRALQELVEAGASSIVFNHHPGGHPAPANKYDLRIIPRMKELLGIPIGTADHYDGYEMVYGAVAVGCNVIEKPVTRDKFIRKPEHIWGVSLGDLTEVIQCMHNVYQGLGISQRKDIKESANRVCLVANTDLPIGSELTLENVLFGRPNNMGVSVRDWDIVSGRKLVKNRKKGEFIRWEDI
ncbi:MAG: hypothetical protein GY765_33100, partial [bacterium]|nr:hypothetical protein [bacterium]